MGRVNPSLVGTKGICMRIDKLTTKFQEALGEAQTLALGADHLSFPN